LLFNSSTVVFLIVLLANTEKAHYLDDKSGN